jgi:hypothetical protein
MSTFESYANKYKTIRMERRDGILQMTLHTDGGPLRWGFLPHGELPEAFHDVGSDYDNRVVIITGTGDEFSGPRANPGTSSFLTRPPIERIIDAMLAHGSLIIASRIGIVCRENWRNRRRKAPLIEILTDELRLEPACQSGARLPVVASPNKLNHASISKPL